MADNTTLNPGTGGDTIATDDISGIKHQLVKIEYGALDSATLVSTSNPLPVSLANTGSNATAVKTDGSAVTQPVSGTVTANAGTGTMAVSASSLPLPTGAATSAKQPALGTAGSASSDVLTVQGVTSMTALKVDGSGVTQPVSGTVTATVTGVSTATNQTGGSQKTQVVDGSGNVIGATSNALDVNIKSGASSGAVAQGSTTSGQTGSLVQGAVTTSAPTYTTAQTNPLSLTTAGALRTDASATTQPVSLATNTPTLQSGSTTAVTQATASNLNATVVGTGTFAVQAAQGTATNLKAQAESYQGGTAVGSGNPLQVTLANTGANATAVKVDNSAVTQPVSNASLTTLGGTVVTEDAAGSSGQPSMLVAGQRIDSDASPVSADGDWHNLVFNAIGRLKVSALPAATVATTGTITTSTSAVTADVTHAASTTVQITGTYAGVNIGFFGSVDGGTTYVALQGTRLDTNVVETTSGVLTANTTRLWTFNVAGMTNMRVLASAYTSGTGSITIAVGAVPTEDTPAVSGQTAAGSALTVNPVTTGGQAKTANPTAVTDGQVVNATFDKLGKQVVVGSVRDLKANQVTTITSSTSETTIVTAVASTFLDLYGLIITNTSATAVNVAIKDVTAGTTRLNIAVPAGDTRGYMLPESGGIKQSAVNNNWTATSSASVASLVITALTVANT